MAICTPPNVRHRLAREAIEAGKHVLLEKPAAPTLAEIRDLTAHAARRGKVLFAASHSQFHRPVEPARRLLVGRRLARVAIDWTEEARVWHPGQEWVWEDGNFGVFDTGINALSILAKIAPGPVFVKSGALDYPANRDTPIAASLVLVSPAAAPGAQLTARVPLARRRPSLRNRRVDVDAVDGPRLSLIDGGAKLLVDGRLEEAHAATEYAEVYARFAELIVRGESVVDGAGLELVADAFRLCERRIVEPFYW